MAARAIERSTGTGAIAGKRPRRRDREAGLTPHRRLTIFRASGERFGAIAQLGERVVRNDEVGGSIPPSSTNRIA